MSATAPSAIITLETSTPILLTCCDNWTIPPQWMGSLLIVSSQSRAWFLYRPVTLTATHTTLQRLTLFCIIYWHGDMSMVPRRFQPKTMGSKNLLMHLYASSCTLKTTHKSISIACRDGCKYFWSVKLNLTSAKQQT